MLLHKRHRQVWWDENDQPRGAFWRGDEVTIGQLRWILAVLLMGLVVFVFVITYGYFYVSGIASTAKKAADKGTIASVKADDASKRAVTTANENRELIQAMKDLQRKYNRQRVANDRRIDSEVRDAVCIAIQDAPKTSPTIKRLRREFRCPKGRFRPVGFPPGSGTIASPSPTPSVRPSTSPTLTGPGKGKGKGHGKGHSTATATVTKTITPTPTSIIPIPVPIPTSVCSVIPGICIG